VTHIVTFIIAISILVLLSSYFVLASAQAVTQPYHRRIDVFTVVATAIIAVLLISMAIVLFDQSLYEWHESILPRLRKLR
jgi:uncharacterized membrane protein